MDWLEDAAQQVIDASLPGFSGKADAVAYYQKEFPGLGKGGWKHTLIRDLLPFTPRTGKDPAKNLAKRFEARLASPEKKNAKQYQELARSLALRKPPPNGYHVHYSGGIQFSDCEQRSFDADIVGEAAQAVCDDPTIVIDVAIMIYMQLSGEDEAPGYCDEQGSPEVTITANPSGYKPKPVKKHKPAVPFLKRNR